MLNGVKKSGLIYGLKCPIINKFIYIGRTVRDPKIRLKEHKKDNFKKKNKVGYYFAKLKRLNLLDDIEMHILEDNIAAHSLNERELYWMTKCVFCKNLKLPDPTETVLCFSHSEKTRLKLSEIHSLEVFQFSLGGKFIKKWKSRQLASDVLGIPKSSINNSCAKITRSGGGFIWSNIRNLEYFYLNRRNTVGGSVVNVFTGERVEFTEYKDLCKFLKTDPATINRKLDKDLRVRRFRDYVVFKYKKVDIPLIRPYDAEKRRKRYLLTKPLWSK